MKSITVSFTYTDNRDFDYEIVAKVTLGQKAPAQNFDRFQEPDDPDEVEIISVGYYDGVGKLAPTSEMVFTNNELEEIKQIAIETA